MGRLLSSLHSAHLGIQNIFLKMVSTPTFAHVAMIVMNRKTANLNLVNFDHQDYCPLFLSAHHLPSDESVLVSGLVVTIDWSVVWKATCSVTVPSYFFMVTTVHHLLFLFMTRHTHVILNWVSTARTYKAADQVAPWKQSTSLLKLVLGLMIGIWAGREFHNWAVEMAIMILHGWQSLILGPTLIGHGVSQTVATWGHGHGCLPSVGITTPGLPCRSIQWKRVAIQTDLSPLLKWFSHTSLGPQQQTASLIKAWN